jgi:hypothetical protein
MQLHCTQIFTLKISYKKYDNVKIIAAHYFNYVVAL